MGGAEVDPQGGGGNAGVKDGVVVKGKREGLYYEGKVGEFRLVLRCGGIVDVGAQTGQSGDVNLVGVEEMGDGEGAGHCFEHVGLDWGESDGGLVLDCCGGVCRGRGRRRGRGGARRSVVQDVFFEDSTVLTGADDFGDVDLKLFQEASDSWRG